MIFPLNTALVAALFGYVVVFILFDLKYFLNLLMIFSLNSVYILEILCFNFQIFREFSNTFLLLTPSLILLQLQNVLRFQYFFFLMSETFILTYFHTNHPMKV